MEVQFSPYRPELLELPEVKDATAETIRLRGTLAKRLPAMPAGNYMNQDLSFTNVKQIEAEQLMNEMRAAYAVSRSYDKRNKAVAKARARQNDRNLKNSASHGRRTRKKIQGRTKRMEKSTVLRNARDVLGMGTDLYR